MRLNEKKFRETIDFTPHQGQQEVLDAVKSEPDQVSEYSICAGRQWGKTSTCAYIGLMTLAKNLLQLRQGKGKPATIWIVAPNYELTKKVFNQMVKWFVAIFPQYADKISHRPPAHIHLPGGIRVECKSGESLAGMLGEAPDLVIMDEASRTKRECYESYLYPGLDSASGLFIAISTPFGKNWFFDFYNRVKSFHFTSKDGVNITEEKWERAKQLLPKAKFDQEYRAIFLDSAYSVFKRKDISPEDCLEDAKKGHSYIMGLDLAKQNDWTVITVIDQDTNKVVYWERYQKQSYSKNRLKVSSVATRYNEARIIIDSQNVGASFGDELRNMGHLVDDYSTAGRVSKDLNKRGKKQQIIERLQVFIEGGNLTIPNKKALIEELESYSLEMTPKGTITYSAPQGQHDDCIDSLALAVWGLTPQPKPPVNKMKEELKKVKKVKSFI